MDKEDNRIVAVIIIIGIAAFMASVFYNSGYDYEGSAVEGNSGDVQGFKLLAAASCIPDEGYDVCYSNSNTYKDARAYAKIQGTNLRGDSGTGIIEGEEITYYLDEVYVNIAHTGDRLTVVKGATSWGSPCSDVGCSGANVQDGKYIIAKAPAKNPQTVYFSAWDKDTDNNGYWSWTAVYWGWVFAPARYDLYVIDCYNDTDCEYGEFCDKSGLWDAWSCEVDTCVYMNEPEPQCEGFDLYSMLCYHGENVKDELIQENSKFCGYVCEEGATKSYFCGDGSKVTVEVCQGNEWTVVENIPESSCPVNFWNGWDLLKGWIKGLMS